MIWAIGILYGIVGLMVAIGFRLYRRLITLIDKAERVLGMIAEHNKVGASREERVVKEVKDARADTVRAATTAASVASAARAQIEAMPDLVAEKLRPGNGGSKDSGERIPVVPVLPAG